MLKCARHQPGLYATLLNDVCHSGFNLKYRPKVKPTLMGVYESQTYCSKMSSRRQSSVLQPMAKLLPSESTWDPAEHLPKELITTFQNRSFDSFCADECWERLALLFAMGLKSPRAWNETIMMWHDVVRVLFPGLLSDLHGPLYLAIEEELIAAGLSPYLKKCLTVTGNGCCIDPLVNLKLLLGNLLSFIDEQGHKTAPCPVEKVQINFMKSHFAECN